MNTDPPLYEPDADATYQLEIVAQITGISSETILGYLEEGLIRPAGEAQQFDEEAVRTLRRIEHLRSSYETNLPGLRLILRLIEQVEQLQSELRARR
jgi:DNA-binding transcriptional MerR regulator